MDIKAIFNEVALTSDSSALCNSALWNVETGADLRNLLGGKSVPNSLRTFGIPSTLRYAISSYKDKQHLVIWNLYAGDAPVAKISTPGPVSSLAVTNNGAYCVASIDMHIYIWVMATGDLLCVLTRHFSPVSCLKFSAHENYLVSAGNNGSLMVWNTFSLISGHSNMEPLHEWRAHSMAIMDMAVGKNFVVTGSEDQTCKVFSLQDGQLVSTVSVGECVTAVATNLHETILVVGTARGAVLRIQLGHDLKQEYQAQHTNFRHSARINSIAISQSGLFFITGSNDCTAKVWDMNTLNILQSKTFRGPVTNAVLLFAFNPLKPTRGLVSLPFCSLVNQPLEPGERPETLVVTGAYAKLIESGPEPSCQTQKLKELEQQAKQDLIQTITEKKQANKYLFDFMISNVLKD